MIHLPPLPVHIRALGVYGADVADESQEGRFLSPRDCPTCGGKGFFYWYVRDSVEWWRNKEKDPHLAANYVCPHYPDFPEQWVLYRNLMDANIGLHLQRLSVADFATDQAAIVLEYLTSIHAYYRAGIGLLLHGTMGTGKTLTAVLIAKAAMAFGFSVYYTPFADMVTKYRNEYRWKNEERQKFYRHKIEASDFLVIDEIGRESRMGYQASITNEAIMSIDLVIRRRMERCLPTLMTTNLTPDQVRDAYGANIASLLANCDVHEFFGSDYRSDNRSRALEEAKKGLIRPIHLAPISVLEMA